MLFKNIAIAVDISFLTALMTALILTAVETFITFVTAVIKVFMTVVTVITIGAEKCHS